MLMTSRRLSTVTTGIPRALCLLRRIAGPLGLLLLPAVAVFLPGCGESTAIDLTLEPDAEITNESELIQTLKKVKLVLDSPQGLYPSAEKRREGSLTLEDLDGDNQDELWTELNVEQLGRLPIIRVEQGGLTTNDLEVEVMGIDREQGQVIASGAESDLHFTEGAVTQETIIFNLKLDYQQPRVTGVRPKRDETADVSIDSVLIYFSKVMSHDSLSLQSGAIKVVRMEGTQETLIPARLIKIDELNDKNMLQYTAARYLFQETPLKMGSYRVRVSTAAQDLSGRGLDQHPATPQTQTFESAFTVNGEDMTGAEIVAGCEGTECPPLVESGEACPLNQRYDPENKQCVPLTCDPADCAAHDVCDPSLGICVPSCKIHGDGDGSCPEETRCQESGLCE